jgi:hypothetical protein
LQTDVAVIGVPEEPQVAAEEPSPVAVRPIQVIWEMRHASATQVPPTVVRVIVTFTLVDEMYATDSGLKVIELPAPAVVTVTVTPISGASTVVASAELLMYAEFTLS